jgi:DNA-binding NarL/FixJ family response regulator
MIRVLVVEARPAVRDGLKRLLAAAGEITVVGETAGPGEGGEVAARGDCDLALLGLAAAGEDALADLRRLVGSAPGLRVLVVGPGSEAALAEAALGQGASGYLDIARAREELVGAVRLVCRGGRFVSAPEGERGRRAPARPAPAGR